MATDKQIAANRRNAQKSTGPRTPEGKAKSSRNALKHGLASISPHALLSVEDKSGFDRMLHGYILTYKPNHADEVDLITDAVFCKWRQQRIWNVESTLVEMTIAEQQHDLQRKLPKANVAAHVANATRINSEENRLNRRYEAQLHRQYIRNLKLLRELQAERTEWDPTLDELYPDTPPTSSLSSTSPASPAPSAPTHSHPAPAPVAATLNPGRVAGDTVCPSQSAYSSPANPDREAPKNSVVRDPHLKPQPSTASPKDKAA